MSLICRSHRHFFHNSLSFLLVENLIARVVLPQAGASTEEVMNCMKAELSKSGVSEEEILQKTLTVMKAFGRGDDSGGDSSLVELSLASRQKNSALKEANISPKDFAKVGRDRARGRARTTRTTRKKKHLRFFRVFAPNWVTESELTCYLAQGLPCITFPHVSNYKIQPI